jgi:hypothetical protein
MQQLRVYTCVTVRNRNAHTVIQFTDDQLAAVAVLANLKHRTRNLWQCLELMHVSDVQQGNSVGSIMPEDH